MRRAALVLVASCWLAVCARAQESFDVVLKSGRVIDPETNLDGVRDVGIRGDTIARISTDPLTGKYVLRFTAGPGAPPGMASVEDRGNYLAHWRHEADGQWRVVADAPVSELPLNRAPGQ